MNHFTNLVHYGSKFWACSFPAERRNDEVAVAVIEESRKHNVMPSKVWNFVKSNYKRCGIL